MVFLIQLLLATPWSSASVQSRTVEARLWREPVLVKSGAAKVSVTVESKSAKNFMNSDGKTEGLGGFSRQTITEGETVVAERVYQAKVQTETFTPTVAFGLLPSWTLLARLPITRIRTSVATNSMGAQNQVITTEMKDRSRQTTPNDSESSDHTQLGQFELRSRHRLKRWESGPEFHLIETVAFPTAEESRRDFVTLAESEHSGFAAGFGVQARQPFTGNNLVYGGLEYRHHFIDRVLARDTFGFPTEDKIRRQPGAEWMAELGARSGGLRMVELLGGVRYRSVGASAYSLASPELIRNLGGSEATFAFVGLVAPKFAGEWTGSIQWQPLLQGQNVIQADSLTLDIGQTF